MNDDFPFLRTIAERPTDLGPRLVFADWLEERGDVYAEFIRLQIELEQLKDGPERQTRTTRARELFDAHWREWLLPVCAALDDFSPLENAPQSEWLTHATRTSGPHWLVDQSRYRWGYLRNGAFGVVHHVKSWEGEQVRLEAADFACGFADSLSLAAYGPVTAEHLNRLADCSPLRQLRLTWESPDDWRKIDGPHFAPLQGISLRGHPSRVSRSDALAGMLHALGESTHLQSLRSLTMESPEEATSAIQAAANFEFFGRIRELTVYENRTIVGVLASSGFFDQFQRLEIRSRSSAGDAAPIRRNDGAVEMSLSCDSRLIVELLALPQIHRVERISIGPRAGQATVLPAIASSPHLVNLRELTLVLGESRSRRRESDMMSDFFLARSLKQLETLDMTCNLGSPDTWGAISLAAQLPALKRFSLRVLGACEAAGGILNCTLPPHLKHLDLSACRINEVVGAALAEYPGLEQLELLDLRGNTMREGTKARFRKRLGERVLL